MAEVPDQQVGSRPEVVLAGAPLPAHLEPQLVAVEVGSDLCAPGWCVLTFADPSRSLLRDLGVAFDQEVEVRASAVEEQAERPLFQGRVYGLDVETDGSGSRAHVRAYDATQGLRQLRQVKSWNDVTDADLVRELAGDAGVAVGDIDAATYRHPHVAQLGETHWEFLDGCARRSGRLLFATGGAVSFTRLPEATGGPATGGYRSQDPLELIPGHNAHYLRGSVAAALQVGAVEARGWDPRTKREVVASVSPRTRGATAASEPAGVGSSVGARSRTVAVPAMAEQSLVEDLASAVGSAVAGAHTYLEARTTGDPRLQAGVVVAVGECGPLDGAYTVTSASHLFDRDGYHTEVQLSSGHDRSLYGLLRSAPGERDGRRPPGSRPAIVTNVEDPEKLGRVKLAYPWLADSFETGWARVVQIGAGPERGLLWFPEVGDEVLVSFIDDDPEHPVVVGGLFNGQDAAPFSGLDDHGDGRIDKRGMRTRIGHELLLDDTGGSERIEIRSADGKLSILLDQAGGAITIDCDGDISVTSTGAATVRARGDVAVEAQGNASFTAGGNLTIEASGRVAVSGSTIALN